MGDVRMNNYYKYSLESHIKSSIYDSLKELNSTFTDNEIRKILNTLNKSLAENKINFMINHVNDKYKRSEMKKFLIYEKHKNEYTDLQSNHYHVHFSKPMNEEMFLDYRTPYVNKYTVETYQVRLDPIAFQNHMLGYAKLHEETKQFVFKIGGML